MTNDTQRGPVKPPSFPLLKEGDAPVFETGAGLLGTPSGGYLPEPEVLSILDAKPRPEKPDYLRVAAAVGAVLLAAVAIRVTWYYATTRVELGTSPLERPAEAALIPRQVAADPNAPPVDDTLYYAGPDVTLPVLRSKFAPAGRAGDKVVLLVVIDPSGKPVDARVWKGLSPDLNVRALQAVTKWRFRPGTKDGRPVPVTAQLEIEFRQE